MPELLGKYKILPREIYVLFFARFVNSLGAFVYPLLSLILTQKVGFSSARSGEYIMVLTLVQGLAMLIGGKLADVLGRKNLIVFCQIAGAASYTVCGFLPPSETMIWLIIATSALYSVTFPANEAITMDVTKPENRKEAFGLLYMGFNLGFVAGPVIGGLLFKDNLPLVFIGDAATTILSTLLLIFLIKETKPEKSSSPEGLEKYSEESIFTVLWKRKKLLAFAGALFLFEFAYMQWGFELPLQTQALFPDGISLLGIKLPDGAAVYGIIASFNGILVIALTPFVTFFMRKWRPLSGMTLAGCLFALSFGMLIFFKSIEAFYIMMFIMTAGEVLSTVDHKTWLADNTPSSHRGRVNSAVQIISGASRAASPLIIGIIIDKNGMDLGWLVISSAALLGAVSVFALSAREKRGIKQDECVQENQQGILQ